jgi:membrane fusion protein, heavy metal efflux system
MADEIIHDGRRTFGLWAVAAALVVGLLAGGAFMRFQSTPADESKAAEAEKAPPKPPGVVEISEEAQKNGGVQVATVAVTTLPTALRVTGVVAPEESRVSHIRPLARGVIEQIFVSLGARVSKGQTLVAYDNIEMGQLVGEYLSAKAAQQQTEADLDVRRRALERAEELIKLEAVAQQTLELRRAEFRNAEAAVTSQRAGVTRIEEQLHRFGLSDDDLARLTPQEGTSAHRIASHASLRSPVSGVVTKYDVAVGELVGPDTEVFTISDLSTVWVLADVYEKDLGKVRPDVSVAVHVDAYPERVFNGTLTYVSDLIDPQTRTAKVRCVVPNGDGALKLDMFTRVAIPTAERRQGLAVPRAAVQTVGNMPIVFVRESATTFARRDVTLGAEADGRVEVLKGLKAGDVVVSEGSFYLKTALLREQIGEAD